MNRQYDKTAAEEAKALGLASLTQAANMMGTTTASLRNWHRDNPARFQIILHGCAWLVKQHKIQIEIARILNADLTNAEKTEELNQILTY